MVLAQIIISSTVLNGSYFTLPMRGKCNIKILSIETHAANKNTFLQLQSDILQLPFSTSPYFTWFVEPQQNHTVDSSSTNQPHFNNIDVQGKVYIKVVEIGGIIPDGFLCVINLSIEKYNEYSPTGV